MAYLYKIFNPMFLLGFLFGSIGVLCLPGRIGISENVGAALASGTLGGLLGYFGSIASAERQSKLSYENTLKEQDRHDVNLKVNSGNRALLTIYLQLTILANIKMNIYDVFENSINRFIDTHPYAHPLNSTIAVDCEALIFLVQSNANNKDLLLSITLLNQKYNSIVLLINLRNDLVLEARQILSDKGFPDWGSMTTEAIVGLIGINRYGKLFSATEHIYSSLKDVITYAENMNMELYNALVEINPKGDFLLFRRRN